MPQGEKEYHGMIPPPPEHVNAPALSKSFLTTAVKQDHGKTQFALVPKRALKHVADVATFGAQKYDAGNWKEGNSFTYDRLLSAAERHVNAFELGEDNDPESGLSHLGHAAWCLMALLDLHLAGHGTDNRQKIQYIPKAEPKG